MDHYYGGIYIFILYSVFIGFSVGLVYELFRFIRTAADMTLGAVARNIICFVCDILFFIGAAVISAIFIFYANNGRIRGIALLGSFAGFILYYHTLGRLMSMLSRLIVKAVYGIIGFVTGHIIRPVMRFCIGVTDILYTVGVTGRRIRKFKRKGC